MTTATVLIFNNAWFADAVAQPTTSLLFHITVVVADSLWISRRTRERMRASDRERTPAQQKRAYDQLNQILTRARLRPIVVGIRKATAMSIRAYTDPVAPTPETVTLAGKVLEAICQPDARMSLHDQASGTDIPLTPQALELLRLLMRDLALNKAVSIVPVDQSLTPNQAANLLHVSRSTIMRLIADGTLSAHQVGSHHRITLPNLLAYKCKADADFEAGMDELVAVEQELGLD
jgi:excisionase family DNA binding protein